MANDMMDYPKMVESAMRGLVRRALERTAKDGLLGEHHYYVTFRTDIDGAEVPDYLRERFPEEMTIVIQHQFWDLDVRDDGFSLTLSFNGKPEPLSIPFTSITGFFDPSVQFGLQFKLLGKDALFPEERAKSKVDPDPSVPAVQDDDTEENKTDKNVVTLDAFRKS